jgi:hypothetical protein
MTGSGKRGRTKFGTKAKNNAEQNIEWRLFSCQACNFKHTDVFAQLLLTWEKKRCSSAANFLWMDFGFSTLDDWMQFQTTKTQNNLGPSNVKRTVSKQPRGWGKNTLPYRKLTNFTTIWNPEGWQNSIASDLWPSLLSEAYCLVHVHWYTLLCLRKNNC